MTDIRKEEEAVMTSAKEWAAMEFAREPLYDVDLHPERAEQHEQNLIDIAMVSRMARSIASQDKATLIANIRKGTADQAYELVEYIARVRQMTEALAQLMDGAECRVLVASANVWPDDDSDGPRAANIVQLSSRRSDGGNNRD